jgi:hypothetical protein
VKMRQKKHEIHKGDLQAARIGGPGVDGNMP